MRGAAIAPVLRVLAVLCVPLALCGGCAYKGGKVVDGTNLAIGMKIPGTEWNVSLLDYVGGVRVAGQDSTRITVTNEVAETNTYFGVVETRRHTRMSAEIAPVEAADCDPSGCAAAAGGRQSVLPSSPSDPAD